MDLKLCGKKVLVIGASKGIGRAVSIGFAKEKSEVTVIARTENLLISLVKEMSIHSNNHKYVVADMFDVNTCLKVTKKLLKENKYYDIVIHCIGGPLNIRDPLSPVELWEKVWYYNVGISININNIIIPTMIKNGFGRIVHISSISGIMLRGAAPYACSKAYLNAYIKTLGREIAKTGVIVCGVLPGAVIFPDGYWDLQTKNNIEKVNDFLRHHQAVGRFGTTDEITNFILFLSSEKASFSHACLFPIDGANM